MPIKYHPDPGTLLMCNFDEGFKLPEMVKTRPVVVVSKNMKGRNGLVTVIPLSTARPEEIESYHYQIPKSSLPNTNHFQVKDNWLKGDMIYTVAFQRLDMIRIGKNKDRNYFTQRLGKEQMKLIYSCMLNGLGIGSLAEHL